MQSHRPAESGFGDFRRIAFLVDSPHPFKIVEAAHFWPEQVHYYVASIDQDPVGIGEAFDSGSAAGLFNPLGKLLGNRGNLSGRTPFGDHHMVCNIAFARQRNGDNVLSLIIVERFHDQRMERV
jgi:hypothetical protein